MSTKNTHFFSIFINFAKIYLGGKMERLKKLRIEKGLSQVEAAKIFNLSYRGYQNIEYGYCETGYQNLKKFADYFGVSVDYLLGHQVNDPTRPKEATMLQRQLCQDILALDEDDCARDEAYIAGIKAKNQEQQKIKKQYAEEDS